MVSGGNQAGLLVPTKHVEVWKAQPSHPGQATHDSSKIVELHGTISTASKNKEQRALSPRLNSGRDAPFVTPDSGRDKMENMEQLLRLRLLVGFLGEKSQFAWWHTAFFGATGNAALAYAFPRSTLLAQFTGASESARQLHDAHIGVGRVFHLFRLPEEVEQDLHRLLNDAGLVLESDILSRQDAAEAELKRLTGGAEHRGEGPVVIGDKSTLATQSAIQKMASLYLSAFQDGTRVYPYFRAPA